MKGAWTVMVPHISRLAGNFVAECPQCHAVCAYWDEDDLDEDGDLLCFCEEDEIVQRHVWPGATCRHCQRTIYLSPRDGWIDPEATGDDSIWREVCDEHDTFQAEHEPEEDW